MKKHAGNAVSAGVALLDSSMVVPALPCPASGSGCDSVVQCGSISSVLYSRWRKPGGRR